ncbi:MAG: glycosyltransferase family 1 protein [Candidatus Saccharibacteria bacterium]|nr:glycosyltransferase family 1 protein [Rhodoferax sp.]
MRIALLDTYYPNFLAAYYAANSGLAGEAYAVQQHALTEQVFGTSDFYSRHLCAMGLDAYDLIVNCMPLQKTWAQEHHMRYNSLALRLPQRLLRLPLIGPWLSALPGLVEIAVEQVKVTRPDVLYCQDLWFLTPQKLAELRPYVKLIVGQIASPMPPEAYLKSYDLIMTSFPHFVPRLRAMGVASEYFRIGFDTRVLELLGPVEKEIDASFVGGISRHHGKALPMLEYLARNTPIQFFGYGAGGLSRSSPLVSRHHGEVWGLDMYRALARSRVTLNRHINVAENNANNMRLYEATGVGALLITDRKDNLSELFEVGKEVVAYSSPEEAAEMIRYYIAHPEEARLIARAGQERTLKEHTYKKRMDELLPLLARHL